MLLEDGILQRRTQRTKNMQGNDLDTSTVLNRQVAKIVPGGSSTRLGAKVDRYPLHLDIIGCP